MRNNNKKKKKSKMFWIIIIIIILLTIFIINKEKIFMNFESNNIIYFKKTKLNNYKENVYGKS